MTVVAWTDNWNSDYEDTEYTAERHKALVERVKKREYNFSYQMFMNPYTTPVFDDMKKCIITKKQWDEVLYDAYGDRDMPIRCTPMDVLTIKQRGCLWEKEKFLGGHDNG